MGQQNKKNVRMVLYRVHDYDLIQYYVSLQDRELKNPKISFSYVMKGLLKDFVRNEHNFSAPIIRRFSDKKMPSKIYVRFTLDKAEDADILVFLNNIKDRQTNSFLKSLLRRQLDVRGLRCYLNGETEVLETKQKADKPKTAKIKNIEAKAKSQIIEEKPVISKAVEIPTIEEKVKEIVDEHNDEQVPTFDFFGNLGNINQI